ncbi:hypothetical protein LshimejAT787_1700180 [Lyophyllum shimeji]|uniref:DUF6534 domain-containing protein n=1 Tax=Lyophyllum shimeji TaxID=47721 RepID=A0A9P3PZB4_LYOSH|nr:hypothetical protein LshimejAT787_1700180 [Lyophyllum shimeji]
MTILDNTIGAAFLGAVFAAMLYGVTNLQVYLYYQNYRNDWRMQKISVALLWVLDTFHLGLTIAAVYHYLITSFGSLVALGMVVWTFKLQIAVNVVIIIIIQTLYAIRVWKLGRHHQRIWPILVALIVMSGYAIGVVLAVKTYNIRTFAEMSRMSWVIYASFSWSTAIDIVIATAMCFYLIRSKSGFAGTNNKIFMIIRMTLISGFLTSACSLAALITYATMPDTLVFLGIEFLLTKLYINSFLAMLNARQSVQNSDSSPGNTLSLSKIVNIRTTTVTSGAAFDSDDAKSHNVPLSPLGQYRHAYDPNYDREVKAPMDSSPNSPVTDDPPTHSMDRYRGATAVMHKNARITSAGEHSDAVTFPLCLRTHVRAHYLHQLHAYDFVFVIMQRGTSEEKTIFSTPPASLPARALHHDLECPRGTSQIRNCDFDPDTSEYLPGPAAVKKPEYAHLVDDYLERYPYQTPALDFMRDVYSGGSVSVDPRLANDHDTIVAKNRNSVEIFEDLGYPPARVLIKIPGPATYRVSWKLKRSRLHLNCGMGRR